jgi:hypothetical protein
MKVKKNKLLSKVITVDSWVGKWWEATTKSDNETCMHLNQGSYTRTMRRALACLHSSVAFWAPFWRLVEFRGNLSPNGGSKKRVSCCNRTLYHWATNATLPREKSAPDVSRCEFVMEWLAWVYVHSAKQRTTGRPLTTHDHSKLGLNSGRSQGKHLKYINTVIWLATIASLQSSFFMLVGCDQPQQSTIPE